MRWVACINQLLCETSTGSCDDQAPEYMSEKQQTQVFLYFFVSLQQQNGKDKLYFLYVTDHFHRRQV